MKRVAVVGAPGAGKTTFCLKLSRKTGLPVYHIDQYFLEKPEYWVANKDEWIAFVKNIINKDSWIIDGNYSDTIEERFSRADTIVLLSATRIASYKGIVQRRLEYAIKARPGMPEGWKEKVNIKFLKFVWKFHSEKEKSIRELVYRSKDKNTLIFKSRKQANIFIENL